VNPSLHRKSRAETPHLSGAGARIFPIPSDRYLHRFESEFRRVQAAEFQIPAGIEPSILIIRPDPQRPLLGISESPDRVMVVDFS